MFIKEVLKSFVDGLYHARLSKRLVCQHKAMRESFTERQLDKIVEDSFPASDPPSTY